MPRAGLFLDIPYTHSLFSAAYAEDLAYVEPVASIATGESVHVTPPSLQNRIIAEGSDPRLRNVLYQMLVVFEKCYLTPHIGLFDIQPLVDRGIAEYSPYPIAPKSYGEFDESQAQALAPLIKSVLRQRGKAIDERRFKAALEQEEPSFDESPAQPELDRFGIELAYGEIMDLIWQSKELESPALTSLAIPRWTKKQKSLEVPATIGRDEEIVVGLFFKGLKHLKVTSLQDVEKYRGHRKIVDFRNEVTDCIERIKTGDITSQQVEDKIRRANESIRRVRKAKGIGRWLTWISIPVAALSFLAGLPIGLATASIGTGAYLHRKWKRWRLKWTLLSK